MDELQLSDVWLMILAAQFSILLALPALLFKFGTTLQTIEDTIKIITKHSDIATLCDIKPSIDSFETELRKDESRVKHPTTWIFAFGFLIIISTLMIASYLANDVRATKSIRTDDVTYHQKKSVFLISPAEWEVKLTQLAKTRDLDTTELPNTLGLKQEDIVGNENLLFVENYSSYYELLIMVLCLAMTALPILYSIRIRRRVLRNAIYITAGYAYAVANTLPYSVAKKNREFAINVVNFHRNNCANYRKH
ncbi:MAG: hypothetical protein ABW092_01115 [Candidatus Thiodiazotropha sp.]